MMKDNSSRCWLAVGIMFVVILALNIWMPYHRDDYDYSLIWNTATHISSLGDVFESLYRHYLEHGGRMVAFLFLDIFLCLFDKLVFDVANALMFVAFLVLLYMHGRRSLQFSAEPALLLVAIVLGWLCFPHFAEVVIWKCGATVYLWTGTIAAAFLLPYNLYMAGKWSHNAAWLAPLMLAGGIFAGWSVENLAVSVVVITFGLSCWCLKQGKMPAWMMAGAVGSLIGIIGLLASPGNYVRYDEQGTGKGILMHIGNQFAGNGEMLLYVLPAVLIILLAWRLLKADALRDKGIRLEPVHGGLGKGRIILLAFIVLCTVSYFTTGFVGQTLNDAIVNFILTPIGQTRPKTISHLANTMAGFDEMAVYWLFIFFIYSYLKERLGLTKQTLQQMKGQIKAREMLSRYPQLRFAAVMFLLAICNNGFMLAAPTFPARATFSSAAMIIIGTIAILGIPSVKAAMLQRQGASIMKGAAAFLVLFTAGAALLIQHNMYQADKVRITTIAQAAAQGQQIVTLPPIMDRARALRHVYYEDFYNGVTKHGVIIYYGIKDIKVDPLPPWEK